MRSGLGLTASADTFNVYALADCEGPDSQFTTLIISDQKHSRFEQVSGSRHSIGVHSEAKSAWYDVSTHEESLADSASITFLIDHELHMLAFYPESRFGLPLSAKDTVFHDQNAVRLLFKDLLGASVSLFYSKNEYLPLGVTVRNHISAQPPWIHVLFENWGEVDGIKTFFEARFLQDTDVYQYRYRDIHFNNVGKDVFGDFRPLIK